MPPLVPNEATKVTQARWIERVSTEPAWSYIVGSEMWIVPALWFMVVPKSPFKVQIASPEPVWDPASPTVRLAQVVKVVQNLDPTYLGAFVRHGADIFATEEEAADEVVQRNKMLAEVTGSSKFHNFYFTSDDSDWGPLNIAQFPPVSSFSGGDMFYASPHPPEIITPTPSWMTFHLEGGEPDWPEMDLVPPSATTNVELEDNWIQNNWIMNKETP